jgi:hypothetical protein
MHSLTAGGELLAPKLISQEISGELHKRASIPLRGIHVLVDSR